MKKTMLLGLLGAVALQTTALVADAAPTVQIRLPERFRLLTDQRFDLRVEATTLADTNATLQVLINGVDVTEESLEKKREEDPLFPAWTERSFKEGEITEKSRRYANYGKGLFNNECSACHGIEANGHGQAAFSMTKRPANFWDDKYMSFNVDTWYWRISRGVPGTQMPRWELTLSAEQRLTLAAFLKYVAQNKGLGKLKGIESDYGKMPSQAAPTLPDPLSSPAPTK